ncbi:hypothetical protein FO519_002038 [Halicephalobus sp. NKZ332]|nr:hypothetical protein FO519_002038 [Halicephalobus sp. NKZ332]
MVPSKEQLSRIFTSFLKQAPPGEYNIIFDDLRGLNSDEDILNEQANTTLVEFNHKNFELVQHPDMNKTIVSKFNLVTPASRCAEYIEPNSNKRFTYDHLSRAVVNISENTEKQDPQNVAWRAALQKELDVYINNHYLKHGVGTVFIFEGKMVLCIGSHKYQKRNCYNGRWASYWAIPAFSTERVTHSVVGHIDLLTHYFEDGNVQLNLEKDITLNVAYPTDIEGAAKMVLKSITEAETAYAVSAQEKLTHFSDQTFKSLRRPLPITRTKMDWQKVHSYRLSKKMTNPSEN